MKWKDLEYWRTGEWQVVEERLKDYEKAGSTYVPSRRLLFSSLDRVPFGAVRAVVMGQDPYPNLAHATGVAFSVPETIGPGDLPPTLKNIFREYQDDLHYPAPKNGDLTKWCEQGVLLWNVYPSCAQGQPGSHHWLEWQYLTDEIVNRLDSDRSLVFVLLGNHARSYANKIHNSSVIETSHPSPLGCRHGFLGSRIFSNVNSKLCDLKQEPIDWRL